MSVVKQALSVNLHLPASPDYISDPQIAAETQRLYNAINALAYFVDASTGRSPLTYPQQIAQTVGQSFRTQNQDVQYAKANVAIAAGAPCYIRLVGDVYTAYLAQATYTVPPLTFATCICVSSGGVAAGDYGAFCYSGGLTNDIGSIVPGYIYYLSNATPGGILNGPPVGAGTFVQQLGFALDTTKFYMKIMHPIQFN